ncbi:cryptochrome/photolyase family protein [Synechococcus sp. Tobar12-5m-g]|uniref:cryptochrome/photolyase family protein n=1 Tax=unclassified Synechococcus TaxID=2626047 RepID=UPI0020CC7AEE|nr:MULTISPECIES: cryptochrome/photolyase family protein [unclassified Synechococcus]MCP9773761.1 cryptochrome/photolyase family protein [Synechococcus sp. Tobar12-5m-g]MCP9874760.1 cryptochrome/photolyase family protein [Synechococcus sp. Cruz CV-v-12]
MALTLILSDQLHRDWFSPSPLQLAAGSRVLMIEDLAVATAYRYHRLRLLHTFVAMRSFREALRDQGIAVSYHELEASLVVPFWQRLAAELTAEPGDGPHLQVAEIADRGFEQRLQAFCREHGVPLTVLPSPAFLEPVAESGTWFNRQRRPRMATFYQRQRRRLRLLLEPDGSPSGGQWSFDADNRKRLPKGYGEPPLPAVAASPLEPAVRALIAAHFADHPGERGDLWIPFDHAGAQVWLERFLRERLDDFGPFEDALSERHATLHHSLLSPLLNIGLLTPAEVIEATLAHAQRREAAGKPLPIASLEGFLRQLIGWREFVRGIDRVYGERQAGSNFWNHQRRLAPCWWEGRTGLPPLDAAIGRVNRLAYNHHIERLMVISNLMLLCEIHPREVHRWFMELYLDSYEWVMGPNVYGMGLMSDGGLFATKPYICGSNYILKMGDFKKGPWCEIWDGLYWRFIDRNQRFCQANPRLSMMVKLLERIDPARRERLNTAAEAFLARATMVPAMSNPSL